MESDITDKQKDFIKWICETLFLKYEEEIKKLTTKKEASVWIKNHKKEFEEALEMREEQTDYFYEDWCA